MPTVRLVPVEVRVMPLVMVVWLPYRALVPLMMLMVRVVPVVLPVLALQVLHWWMVPLVML